MEFSAEEKFKHLCEEKPTLDLLANNSMMCNEREITKLLLQYGEIENFYHDGVRMSVAQFIIQELGCIFNFYDPINSRILSIYKMCVYNCGEIPTPIKIKDYFRSDKRLTIRIDELLDTPYQTPNWGILGIVLDENEKQKAKMLEVKILSSIIRFKDSRLGYVISEYTEKANHIGSESDKLIYLADIEAMQKLRKIFNDKLGILVSN